MTIQGGYLIEEHADNKDDGYEFLMKRRTPLSDILLLLWAILSDYQRSMRLLFLETKHIRVEVSHQPW